MRWFTVTTVTVAALLAARPGRAQPTVHHEHAPEAADPGEGGAQDARLPALATVVSMTRQPAGTSWQPDQTPHDALVWRTGGLELAAHYQLFAGYIAQTGARGADDATLLGWAMLAATRRFAASALQARVMVSPEAFTVRDGGYPLLLQSGESFEGEPLHDRQHPHELFMELSASYAVALGRTWAVHAYGALAGEPALGPLAFPHRASSAADPLAALGHHWLDSTHISFGVLSAAVVTPMVKLEGSWFNGREPDDQRADLDLRAPDSYAVRLSVNPTPSLSAQLSYGYLASPEGEQPDHDVHRVTASLMHHRTLGAGLWATTAAWGRNVEAGDDTGAFLLESRAELGPGAVFGRLEYVEKTAHDLVLPEDLEDQTFGVTSLSAGYLHHLGARAGVAAGLGVRGTVARIPDELDALYGGSYPVGAMAFLRLTPGAGATEAAVHAPSH